VHGADIYRSRMTVALVAPDKSGMIVTISLFFGGVFPHRIAFEDRVKTIWTGGQLRY
jgi:hypothetical protein